MCYIYIHSSVSQIVSFVNCLVSHGQPLDAHTRGDQVVEMLADNDVRRRNVQTWVKVDARLTHPTRAQIPFCLLAHKTLAHRERTTLDRLGSYPLRSRRIPTGEGRRRRSKKHTRCKVQSTHKLQTSLPSRVYGSRVVNNMNRKRCQNPSEEDEQFLFDLNLTRK